MNNHYKIIHYKKTFDALIFRKKEIPLINVNKNSGFILRKDIYNEIIDSKLTGIDIDIFLLKKYSCFVFENFYSEETIERLKNNSLDNLKKGHSKAAIYKRVKSWKRTMCMEKFRVISCIPQRTNFKFAELPTKAYHAKYHLINKHGYFAFEGEPYILGYDRNTHRMNEEFYKNKYGFSFEEDEECQED